MTQRERLIELIDDFGDDVALCDVCDRPREDCAGCTNEQLAEYLVENGVIVPPVKVGQTVYIVHNTAESIELGVSDCIYETVVDAMCINSIVEYHVYYKKITHPDCDFFTENDLGKNVFLSKEQALKDIERRCEIE